MSLLPIPIALTLAVAAGPALASSIISAPPLEGTPSIMQVEGVAEATDKTAQPAKRRAKTPLIMRGGDTAPATQPEAPPSAQPLPPAEAEPLPGTPQPDLE